jgi:peptidyl-prolyl cis-trans isomerase C
MKALPLSCLALVVALAACSRSSDKVTVDLRRSSSGTPVATYAGGVLTVEDVNKTMGQLPPMVRMRFQSPAQKKEFVERLITLDLLAREAVREGHANDPEVVESLKNVLAQKVVKDERENKSPVVTDEEVQAWYDAHTAEFTRPETWRLSTIFLAVPPSDAAKDKAQMAKADKLLAQAQKLKADDFAGFGQLAKANSEDPSKVMEGDLRALTAAELSSRYGAEVAQAGAALKNPGDLSGLVRTKTGVYILKLRVHTPTTVANVNDVKAQIRTRLQNDHRNQAYEKFIADLKAKAGVQVDEAALAKVLVDVSGKPEGGPPMPRMMMPGQPPAPTQIPSLPTNPVVTPAPTPPAKP